MTDQPTPTPSFFDRPGIKEEIIPVAGGIPFGYEAIANPATGIAGVYGAWGQSYDNAALTPLVEERLGETLPAEDRLNLSELGFERRHHVSGLSDEQNRTLEMEVGARMLKAAAQACGWELSEVQGVLLGLSAPLGDDFVNSVARLAGISESALRVGVHKACDSSVSGLQLALNPALPENRSLGDNLAEMLRGKKILVGGLEGLSRFVEKSRDHSALQLFGNAFGAIGLIPGQSMKFLVGKSFESFDEDGMLQVRMLYPHSGRNAEGSLVEVHRDAAQIEISGGMHEPLDGSNIKMAGPMGMVKLFVRNGVQVVKDVYQNYQERMDEMGTSGKTIAVAIVHHANYKINKLKDKQLQKDGVNLFMPWLLNDFGNVSAASNMIAFLRQLPQLKPGDHVMVDGFGAGTYYDTFVVEIGG